MKLLPLFQPALAETTETEQIVVEEVIDAVDTATTVANKVVNHLPIMAVRLLEAGLVILIGIIVLKYGKRIINRVLRRYRKGAASKQRRIDTLRSISISIFSYLLFFILVVVIMAIFGIDVKTVITMASIGGIAVGFASQTLIKDIIFGLFIWAEGSIGIGDMVRINELEGTIRSLSLRATVIRNHNGDTYTIPNGEIRTITNMSAGLKCAAVDIRCPYDMKQAELIAIIEDEMNQAVMEINGVTGGVEVLNIYAFEPDAVLVRVTAQCAAKDYRRVEREIRARIKDRFDAEGIVMPHYSGADHRMKR